jgi:hypothetical protein
LLQQKGAARVPPKSIYSTQKLEFAELTIGEHHQKSHLSAGFFTMTKVQASKKKFNVVQIKVKRYPYVQEGKQLISVYPPFSTLTFSSHPAFSSHPDQ